MKPTCDTRIRSSFILKKHFWLLLKILTGWSGSSDCGSLIRSSRIDSVWTPFWKIGLRCLLYPALSYRGGVGWQYVGRSDTFRCPSDLVILLSPHISVKGEWNKRSSKGVTTTWTWRPTHHLGQRLDRGRTQQRSRGRSRGGRWALSNAPGNPPQGFYIVDNNPPQRLYIVDIWSTSTFISFCRTILPASLRPSPLHASHRPAVRNIEHFSLAGSSQ